MSVRPRSALRNASRSAAVSGPGAITIIDALKSRALYGSLPAFRDLSTWGPWLTVLAATYGLPLDAEQQAWFCKHTGRTRYAPPPGGWKELVVIVGRQSGKDLAVDTPILTTGGWKTMGTVEVGDYVFGPDGQPTLVRDVTPIILQPHCYDVEFSGGEVIRAGAEHQWLVVDKRFRKNTVRRREGRRGGAVQEAPPEIPLPSKNASDIRGQVFGALTALYPVSVNADKHVRWLFRCACGQLVVRTGHMVKRGRTPSCGCLARDPEVKPVIKVTREIAESVAFEVRTRSNGYTSAESNYAVPNAAPLQYKRRDDLLVDPYVLGMWLGDGDSNSSALTSGDPENMNRLMERGYYVAAGFVPLRYRCLFRLQRELRLAGLLGNKHIPRVYFEASVEQRLELLRGLMDSDGYCSREGKLVFTSINRALADGVLELVRGLGWEATLTEDRARMYGKDCGPNYNVFFRASEPVFYLTRRAERHTPRPIKYRFVRSVTPAPPTLTRCIQVDRPDGLWLAGRSLVVTHNTRIASLIASYESAFGGDVEAGGGELYALMVAQDHRASLRAIFSYARAPFENVPALSGLVVQPKADSIELRNGVVLAAYPGRPASVRGIRSRVTVCDELGWYRSSEGLSQDVEMLRAIRPTLATTGGRLVILSSPAGQSGALYDLYENHFGRDDSPVLIVQASAPELNPTLPADYLARMQMDDPEGYRSEVLGEFRAGLTALLDPAVVRAAIDVGRVEFAWREGVHYVAWIDVSGGRSDAYACAIGHRDGDRIIVDAVRLWRVATTTTRGFVSECAEFLRSYRLQRAVADRYGADWPVERFDDEKIRIDEPPVTKNELFLDIVGPLNSGSIRLPDIADLRTELIGLERRKGTGSAHDRVVHPPGRHDDAANVTAGVAYLLRGQRRQQMFEGYSYEGPSNYSPPSARPAGSVGRCKVCGAWYGKADLSPSGTHRGCAHYPS